MATVLIHNQKPDMASGLNWMQEKFLTRNIPIDLQQFRKDENSNGDTSHHCASMSNSSKN